MSIAALMAARQKLSTDADLTAYLLDRYSKPAKHIVGYRRPNNANDFPVLCYTPAMSTRADQIGGRNKERISIVVGVHEPAITDDVFDGITQLAAIEDLIFKCMETGELGQGAVYLGEPRIIGDLAARHPFHELEISVLVAAT